MHFPLCCRNCDCFYKNHRSQEVLAEKGVSLGNEPFNFSPTRISESHARIHLQFYWTACLLLSVHICSEYRMHFWIFRSGIGPCSLMHFYFLANRRNEHPLDGFSIPTLYFILHPVEGCNPNPFALSWPSRSGYLHARLLCRWGCYPLVRAYKPMFAHSLSSRRSQNTDLHIDRELPIL